MSGAPRQAVPYYDWRFHPNNKSWTFDKGDKTTTRFGRFEDGKFITGKHSCCRYCAIGCLMVGFQEIPQLPPRGPSFYRALVPLRTPPRRQLARQAAIRSASTNNDSNNKCCHLYSLSTVVIIIVVITVVIIIKHFVSINLVCTIEYLLKLGMVLRLSFFNRCNCCIHATFVCVA